MPMLHQALVASTLMLSCYVNPNTGGVHKCLVANSIDLCVKYKCNLKPVTCRILVDYNTKFDSMPFIVMVIVFVVIPYIQYRFCHVTSHIILNMIQLLRAAWGKKV